MSEPDCKCFIHRRDKPDDGYCLCKDVKCDCYKKRGKKKKIKSLFRGKDTDENGIWFKVNVTSNLKPPWRHPHDWPDGTMEATSEAGDKLLDLVREQYTKK